MAKALYAPGVLVDPRISAQIASLRARVMQLEQENRELRLAAAEASLDDDLIALAEQSEPALA